MRIEAYLRFNGNCREAIEYYAEVFKTGKPEINTFGEMPTDPNFEIPEETKNLIMHGVLDIKGTRVMLSDTFPGMPFVVGNNVGQAVISNDIDEIKSIYNTMKEEGTVIMELQETFWSKSYGSLTDKYGIEWQFSHESNEMK